MQIFDVSLKKKNATKIMTFRINGMDSQIATNIRFQWTISTFIYNRNLTDFRREN